MCVLAAQGPIGSLGPINQSAGYTDGSHYMYAFDSSLEYFYISQTFGSSSVLVVYDLVVRITFCKTVKHRYYGLWKKQKQKHKV